jgi:catechol 2,3-dioxygenase-like lactoylglutathione lyase family enzyme
MTAENPDTNDAAGVCHRCAVLETEYPAVYDAAMRLRPMLQVSDVVVASRWYQDALGLTSGHGGDEFEMLYSGDDLVLQLHRLDGHEHGFLQPDVSAVRGAGVSLWFETSDRSTFDALFERAESSGATILERPHWNPLAHHHEATMADSDGYLVVIHSPFEPDG